VTTPGGGGTWEVRGATTGAEVTRRLAAALARICHPGDVVVLAGGLGAGKTTFAQGFARGLGVADPVTSPTFTLVREHPVADGGATHRGVRRLLHADLYRLDSLAEVVDLGLLEQVEEGAVALVEWGDVAVPVLGDEVLTVELRRPSTGHDDDRGGGDEPRQVRIRGQGPGWAARRDMVAELLASTASCEEER
jgi:tRNA threonylcarbamoyladenosine biosynthesis protein TsaE